MPENVVLALASAGPPPRKPGVLTAMASKVLDLSKRLTAIERRPAFGAELQAHLDNNGLALMTRDMADQLSARLGSLDGEIKAAVEARTAEAVAAAVAALPAPQAGKDADPAEVKAMVESSVAAAFATVRVPLDGAAGISVTVEDVQPIITAEVERILATWERPKDAEPVDPETIRDMVRAEVAQIPPAEPGKDVDMDAVLARIDESVLAAVESLPPAQPGSPGASVTIDDVRPLIEEVVASRVAEIPAAKDGVGIVDGIVTAEGRLVLVMTDGRRLDAGPVVKEPVPGPAGRHVVKARITDDHLILVMSDDTEIDAGPARGPAGESIKGEAGRGIADLRIVGTDLMAVFSDGSDQILGRVVGKDGKPGEPGKPGKPGAAVKGDPGATLTLINFDTAGLTPENLGRIAEAELQLSDGTTIRVLTRQS